MKLKEVFEKSVQFFKDKKLDTPRLDAEILISYALKLDRVQIYMKYEQPLKENEVSACRELIRRRSTGEPVAYIVEEKGFFKEIFSVGPGVLIPRPETELVVEHALDHIEKHQLQEPRILDLGAGTGCIGLAILKNAPQAKLVTIEKSEKAYPYLLKNIEKLNLKDRIEVIHGDVEEIDFSKLGLFDLIVSNPPYIAVEDPATEANVKKYEPAEALFSKDQGIYFIKNWSKKTAGFLKPSGLMLFEMGHLQGAELKLYFEQLKLFSKVQIIKDLSGLDRIVKSIR